MFGCHNIPNKCLYCSVGGVYDSPAAALYWEERFGDLFAGGLGVLWHIQVGIYCMAQHYIHASLDFNIYGKLCMNS